MSLNFGKFWCFNTGSGSVWALYLMWVILMMMNMMIIMGEDGLVYDWLMMIADDHKWWLFDSDICRYFNPDSDDSSSDWFMMNFGDWLMILIDVDLNWWSCLMITYDEDWFMMIDHNRWYLDYWQVIRCFQHFGKFLQWYITMGDYKGAFTLTLSEHLCPSQCPSPWLSFVYTPSETRIRGYPRPWPFW